MRLQVVLCLPCIWNNVLRPPLIKSRVWAKREEREREKEDGRAEEDDGGCGGDRDAAAADEEEEGKSERAAEREGDLSASVHVVVT